MKTPSFLTNLYHFYRDGFQKMTVGRTLWVLVIVKLIIMFGILKVFFFPNYLNVNFDDNESKSRYVRQELIDKSK